MAMIHLSKDLGELGPNINLVLDEAGLENESGNTTLAQRCIHQKYIQHPVYSSRMSLPPEET